MSTGRKFSASFVLGGHLYAAGGTDMGGDVSNTVERYDAAADRWSPVAHMNSARKTFRAVVVSGADGVGGEVDLFESLITRAARARK